LLEQVEALARLVEDLRSVSLADSGRLELTLQEVDLTVELEDKAPILRSILEPAGFSL
jgi:two-component system, OmpR family, sensor histidine kinase AdeS